jgi:Tol biopolymer transport system component/DNA-binding winged helix-turn-helix (wHTH) protein
VISRFRGDVVSMMFRPSPPRDRLALPDRFALAEIEVDLAAARASRAGRRLELEPKAFDLLLLLAANPGRVVEKQEIFERLWTGVHVTDNALARVVAHLRRELDDDAEAPRFVETVRTRGYRMLAAAVAVGSKAPAPAAKGVPSSPARRRRLGVVAGVAALLALVLLVASRLARDGGGSAGWSAAPVQRTVGGGFRGGADLSPDGSLIVYSSDAAGGLQLFVRSLEEGRELQITFGGGPKLDPAWSPDGRLIAYRDLGAGGLWVVAPTGGTARQLLEFGAQPAWFPDSRRLVFSHPGRLTIGWLEWPATYASTLWTVDLESGAARELSRLDPEAGGHGSPAVSPDGESVFFATGRLAGGGALWRIAAEGGAAVRLTPYDESGADLWHEPTPTPDGRALLALSVGPVHRVVRLPLAPAGPPEVVLSPAPEGTSQLALARDGRRLLYTLLDSHSSIEEVEVDANAVVVGAPRVLSAPRARRVTVPRYSPDGARVLLRRGRSGVGAEQVVVDRTSGAELRLAAAPRHAPVSVWLDATRVLIHDGDAHRQVDVVRGTIQPAPPEVATLLALAAAGFPRPFGIAPDLGAVAYTAPGPTGALELFLTEVRDRRPRQRTRFGRRVDYPLFSADGRWIGFQVATGDGSTNELWRLSRSGDAPERLATEPGPSWSAVVGRGGERAVYAAHRGGTWYLAVAGVDAPERRLAVPPETVGYLRWATWSPDDRHVAYERMHYEASLWSVDLPGAD